jgi:hypothetical protein
MPNDNGKQWKAHANAASKKARGRPRLGKDLKDNNHSDYQQKACIKCGERKDIKEFSRGHGSFKKRDVCKQCGSLPSTKWAFGSSIRAVNKRDRVNSDSEFFDKKMPPLSVLNDQARMINDRDYAKAEKDE